MIKKIKNWLDTHEKLYELLRYVIAGGLTTVLSILIHYGVCFLLVQRVPLQESGLIAWLKWFAANVNLADPMQTAIASIISWVLSVLFAFWINRSMVFRVEGGNKGSVLKELGEFAGGRVVSYLVFELGLMEVLKAIGISNIVNRLITTILVMIFNYVVSKFWVFRKK